MTRCLGGDGWWGWESDDVISGGASSSPPSPLHSLPPSLPPHGLVLVTCLREEEGQKRNLSNVFLRAYFCMIFDFLRLLFWFEVCVFIYWTLLFPQFHSLPSSFAFTNFLLPAIIIFLLVLILLFLLCIKFLYSCFSSARSTFFKKVLSCIIFQSCSLLCIS